MHLTPESTAPVAYAVMRAAGTLPETVTKSVMLSLVCKLKDLPYATCKHLPAMLGSGHYGCVYDHPTDPDKVIKICWESPSYLQYAAWCMLRADNPYVPKIDSITMVRNAARNTRDKFRHLGIVVMERLTSVNTGKDEYEQYRKFRHAWADARDGESTDLYLNELYAAVQDMGEFIDFHDGNVLLRGMQAVFTDPVAG